METYLVEPLLGVGPVRLGMTREAVRQAMAVPPQSFLKTPHSRHETDAFHQGALQVFYTGEAPTVEYVELSGGGELRAVFEGQSLFETPADELVTILGRTHAQHCDDDATPCDVVLPDLQMGLWRPYAAESAGEEDGRYFATVGIGVPGYYPPEA